MKKQYVMFYIFLWTILLVFYWTSRVDAFAYSLITFYIALPLCLLMISLFGVEKIKKSTHIFFLIFSIMYMLEEYLTFSLDNMISFSKVNVPDFMMIIYSMIILYIGLIINKIIIKK